MDNSALKPNTFVNLPSFVKQQTAEKKGASDEEIQLATMSESAGWKVFSEIANNVLKELDGINEVAIQNGAGREEIGENAIIISMVKGIIKRLMNKVEDAKESCAK